MKILRNMAVPRLRMYEPTFSKCCCHCSSYTRAQISGYGSIRWLMKTTFSVKLLIILSASILISTVPSMGEDHVIVVGGGLAGLAALIEAAEKGAKVTLIEGEKDTGGNSMKSSSGMNGCGTAAQEKMEIKDSFDAFYSDTMKAGDNLGEPELVDVLVHQSPGAVEWLIEKGVNLMDVNLCGGHSSPRTHWIPSPKEGKPTPVGVMIMRSLKAFIEKLQESKPDLIRVMKKTKAEKLIQNEEGKVVGVRISCGEEPCENDEVLGTSVVMATGGFSNDHQEDSLLKEFAPEKMSYPSTNGLFAVGNGVRMGRSIGADLVGMEHVQIHPTGFVDPKDPGSKSKFLAAEALRGSGGILLNNEGNRFANELGRRDYLTDEIQKESSMDSVVGGHVAFLVLNKAAVDKFGWPAFNFYWKIKGFFTEYDGIKAMSEGTGVSELNIQEAFNEYSEASMNGKDPFGKSVFPVTFDGEETLFVGKVTPSIHYTMGGLKISSKAEVISKNGRPIHGFFAAGEVTGGVHGKNRLGGNSLLECVVFGRIAGANAVTLSLPSKKEL